MALLTAGRDKPYALGLASALLSAAVPFDFIGSNIVDAPELHQNPYVRFLNLRDQRSEASLVARIWRILLYYGRLMRYGARARPRLFHILWNNKIELLDRTLLMLYYKSLGKKVILTVHNVNAGERDKNDSLLNRLSLRVQYGLSDHLFAHTRRMKNELVTEFNVEERKISVIPFGINNTVPNTDLTPASARRRIGISGQEKTLLFFGNIAPYKGLEHLVSAFVELAREDNTYRLIIAGRPKQALQYWERIARTIEEREVAAQVIQKIEYISDEETEVFFKAADVLVLPYVHVFQSGVLFLGYSFGLPAIATDVGSLREEVIEGKTGFMAAPADAGSLASATRSYFGSELYRNLDRHRDAIKRYANEQYSWNKVGAITLKVYEQLLAQA